MSAVDGIDLIQEEVQARRGPTREEYRECTITTYCSGGQKSWPFDLSWARRRRDLVVDKPLPRRPLVGCSVSEAAVLWRRSHPPLLLRLPSRSTRPSPPSLSGRRTFSSVRETDYHIVTLRISRVVRHFTNRPMVTRGKLTATHRFTNKRT